MRKLRLYRVIGLHKSSMYSGKHKDRWFVGFFSSRELMTYQQAMDYAWECSKRTGEAPDPLIRRVYVVRLWFRRR